MQPIWKSKYVRIFTITLLLQAMLFYTASHGDSRPLEKPLNEFPKTLSGWQMFSQGIVEKDTLDVLKADDVLSRFYTRGPLPDMSTITPAMRDTLMLGAKELFLAYFSTQQAGQAPHSPKNCLPGSGWQQVDTGQMSVPISGLNQPITINKYVVTKGDAQALVLYWYQSHGRVVASEYTAKFFLVTDSMRYHRSDTAIVRVVSPVINDDLLGALESSTAFVQAVFPAVYRYLPM